MRAKILIRSIAFGIALGLGPVDKASATDFSANEQAFMALVERHWNAPFSVQPISGAHVKTIARRRLDPQVASQIVTSSGVSLQPDPLAALAPTHVQVALFDLCYLDQATAARRQQKLPKSRHFEHSKILIPFSSVVADHCLLVVFTESAGDQNAVRFIEGFPAQWREISPKSKPQTGIDG